jgi:hypothetical protein
MNITYKIARYEQLDNVEFLVAFNVKIENYEIFYIESILPLSLINMKTPEEICQLAFTNIRPRIDELIFKLRSENSLVIGSEFVPKY